MRNLATKSACSVLLYDFEGVVEHYLESNTRVLSSTNLPKVYCGNNSTAKSQGTMGEGTTIYR